MNRSLHAIPHFLIQVSITVCSEQKKIPHRSLSNLETVLEKIKPNCDDDIVERVMPLALLPYLGGVFSVPSQGPVGTFLGAIFGVFFEV